MVIFLMMIFTFTLNSMDYFFVCTVCFFANKGLFFIFEVSARYFHVDKLISNFTPCYHFFLLIVIIIMFNINVTANIIVYVCTCIS